MVLLGREFYFCFFIFKQIISNAIIGSCVSRDTRLFLYINKKVNLCITCVQIMVAKGLMSVAVWCIILS